MSAPADPPALDAATRARLAAASVSTLTTCLFRRGLRNAYLQGIVPVAAGLPRMVGPAFTLRFIPAREDIDQMAAPADGPGLHQRAFEECPPGHVLVIDTHGETEACTCGDLLIMRLAARGAAGIVTDGGFRDSPDVARLGFPAFHARPAPPPSFIRLHALELNRPIGCARVAVYPGDVVVGDGEGVVVIPAHLAGEVAAEAEQTTLYDAFATEKLREGRALYGLYPPGEAARAEYAAWARNRGGR